MKKLKNLKIQIPRLGEELTLTAPWTATLKNESRNSVMLNHAVNGKLHFKAGDVLRVERIYIRASGVRSFDFDSVTFRSMMSPKGRFFVELEEANLIQYSSPKKIVREVHKLRRIDPAPDQETYARMLLSTSREGLVSQIKNWSLAYKIFGKDCLELHFEQNGITWKNLLDRLPVGWTYSVERHQL